MEEKDLDDEECDDTLTMTTVSRHCFGDDSETPSFSISIIENMKEDYGLFVWPCSVVLAEYVWQQKHRFSGATVVELGAGTSLPGLVAAKLGARVTLTDNSTRLEVLDNMRRVCELNKLECNVSCHYSDCFNIFQLTKPVVKTCVVECFNVSVKYYGSVRVTWNFQKVMGLTWGVWDAPLFSLQPTLILGADVLYDSNAFGDLFATVTFLLQNSPGSIFITSYHNRSGHHLIEFLMGKWGLKCLKLLDGFSFLPSDKASLLSGNIQLAEIAPISKDNA